VGDKDVVLLHVCCHNPTGMDLTEQQWASVVDIARQQGWLPFLDFAYQGFGTGLESDRFAVEAMARSGQPFFVASSFSKNFGLYCERTGALTIVGDDAETAAAMQSHLKKTIRVIYSNPPAHGGRIVETIMADDSLRGQWIAELATMRERIIELRSALVEKLHARGVDRDLSYIEKQRGMFSYSGLTQDQVKFLREQKGIYIVGAGRINVAGIRHENLDYLCDSIAEALLMKAP
jgi:aspartate aminotransferase/aromatic-amino-acid transaminase